MLVLPSSSLVLVPPCWFSLSRWCARAGAHVRTCPCFAAAPTLPPPPDQSGCEGIRTGDRLEIAMQGFKKPGFQQLEPKTMAEKIAFIASELGLEDGLPVAKAVAAANEAMGIVSKAAQVARLMTEVRLEVQSSYSRVASQPRGVLPGAGAATTFLLSRWRCRENR